MIRLDHQLDIWAEFDDGECVGSSHDEVRAALDNGQDVEYRPGVEAELVTLDYETPDICLLGMQRAAAYVQGLPASGYSVTVDGEPWIPGPDDGIDSGGLYLID